MPDRVVSYAREHRVELLENQPLSQLTTFRIGGAARYVAHAEPPQLAGLTRLAAQLDLPVFLLGNGSNILASDSGFPGLIIKLKHAEPSFEHGIITAPASMTLAQLASYACKLGLTGLEFAHGIPGTVGGAVYMNAGAYGGQISDCLVSSTCVDAMYAGGEVTLTNADHCFAYRDSIYRHNPALIVTEASFKLTPGVGAEIANQMELLARQRREKQPLEYPSAGSVYKRPPGHFAGKLIEDCGLKGYTVGGAQVSLKHSGFIINRGGAACADVLAVMDHIEQTVQRAFGISLEREVRLLG